MSTYRIESMEIAADEVVRSANGIVGNTTWAITVRLIAGNKSPAAVLTDIERRLSDGGDGP